MNNQISLALFRKMCGIDGEKFALVDNLKVIPFFCFTQDEAKKLEILIDSNPEVDDVSEPDILLAMKARILYQSWADHVVFEITKKSNAENFIAKTGKTKEDYNRAFQINPISKMVDDACGIDRRRDAIAEFIDFLTAEYWADEPTQTEVL
jgi:hypothetical protein